MKKILSLVMALAMVLGCFAMAETTSILDADMDELLVLDRESSLMHRGQSLVVWAIREGREAAREVDKDLMGYTNLN